MAILFPSPPETLHRPRILCLHGGGTNASILSMQARTFTPQLAPHFRLVFADAPFPSDPHPGILPVYEDFGPFKVWSRWAQGQPVCGDTGDLALEPAAVVDGADVQCRAAMAADDAAGATGDWVGLLGFSQGARMVGSFLLEQQLRIERLLGHPITGPADVAGIAPADMPVGFAGGKWRFAVIMSGRGPFFALSPEAALIPSLDTPGAVYNLSTLRSADDEDAGGPAAAASRKRLALPSIHVSGLQDGGLPWNRELRALDCEPASSTVIEWDGDHRLPFRLEHVRPIVKEICRVAKVSRTSNSSHLPFEAFIPFLHFRDLLEFAVVVLGKLFLTLID